MIHCGCLAHHPPANDGGNGGQHDSEHCHGHDSDR